VPRRNHERISLADPAWGRHRQRMRASFYRKYGRPDVLEFGELPAPVAGPGELLVRVHAASLNPKDVLVRRGKFRLLAGRRMPRIPGYDFAGTVEACGAGTVAWAAGTEVYGMIQAWRGGACAELVTCPVDQLAPRPRSIDMQAAAVVPLAALTALQALRDLLRIVPGDRVCINGASGGVGLFAVQIAKILGGHVTAVCSARNAALVTDHGADVVEPYDGDPVAAGPRFDAFFDVFGNRPYPTARTSLVALGRYATTIPGAGAIVRDLCTRWTAHPARLIVVRSNRSDLDQLTQWIDAGRLRPTIDRVFDLAASRDAHAYLETKRARGKIAIAIR
jgi:NADPH:quinone reductase-like Zn-dependent oxidoreductase